MMMKMLFSIMILLISSTMSIEALRKEETPAPAPGSVDCSTVIYDMLDCIPYLTADSKMGKVDTSCCSGLESVVSVDSSCLCFGLKESVDLGINLNFTRALHLPSDCNLSVSPSVTHCSVSSPSPSSPSLSPSSPPPSHSHLSPKNSPSSSPKAPSSSKPPASAPKSSSPRSSSPSPTSSASPKQAPIIASETPAPAPAPTKSGASYISVICILNLVLIMISMINVASLV